jgi:prevent-host-death family protein
MKQEISIRELKNQTSSIVRQVREESAKYMITHDGRPVAILRPINDEDTAAMERQQAIEAWHKMLEIGRTIDENEPEAESAVSILSTLRDEENGGIDNP